MICAFYPYVGLNLMRVLVPRAPAPAARLEADPHNRFDDSGIDLVDDAVRGRERRTSGAIVAACQCKQLVPILLSTCASPEVDKRERGERRPVVCKQAPSA